MAATIFPTPLSGIQETKLTTTGDTLYASAANTAERLAVGSTNQALGVTGGVPAWQASSKSTLTTTGDTMYASAANTPARLGIGSTGQVLTVSSGVPSWATPSAGAAVYGKTLTAGSNKSTTSTSYVAVDSTNLRITASPTGTTAYWIVEGFQSNSGVTGAEWRVNVGAGTVYGYNAYNNSYDGTAVPRAVCQGTITGLTAGTSYNFDWEWKVNAGTTNLIGDTATIYPRMTVIC